MDQLCQTYSINLSHSKPYMHNKNGLVERYNRSIREKLRIFDNQYSLDWDEFVPYVLMSLRTLPTSRNDISTFEIIYGISDLNHPSD
ncbi:hypothetical protein A3Q56_07531 [Intoshia linei]|uniref:Integrase catalytic domain-containing protein n=1 Tax=Intoshia linei TaxID=1819745 RepID=A0A177ARW1_9BILA|nr:hypothetical protein A3Q56_07531 [Intoshia linei]